MASPAATAALTATASPPVATVADLVARIDEAKLQEHMRALASLGSRHPRHSGHARAIEYLQQQLRVAGARVVGTSREAPTNVWAHLAPLSDLETAPEIVVAAHYDSIADRTPGWRPESDPAPGANDNGTGVAGLLEVARILAEEHRAGRLRRTVAVVFFDEEELGMKGSMSWLRQMKGSSRYVVNLDMVGFSAPGRRKLDLMRYASSGDLPERIRTANERYRLGLQLVDRLMPTNLSTWVDSTPFAMAGIPAVTLTESWGQPGIDYPGYPGFHRVTDTPDQITNVAQWRAATQLVLAVVLELAR